MRFKQTFNQINTDFYCIYDAHIDVYHCKIDLSMSKNQVKSIAAK